MDEEIPVAIRPTSLRLYELEKKLHLEHPVDWAPWLVLLAVCGLCGMRLGFWGGLRSEGLREGLMFVFVDRLRSFLGIGVLRYVVISV
jgi:hypothetical protein